MILQLSLKLITNELITSNKDLKSLRLRNLNKIVVGHLNINSTRNKFDFLAYQVQGNTDILMISGAKLDESFLLGQFLLDCYSVPFRSDRLKWWWYFIIYQRGHTIETLTNE